MAMIFSEVALFFSQKVDDLFLVVVVTFKPTRTKLVVSERSNSVVKMWQLIGGPWRRGPLPWYNRHNG